MTEETVHPPQSTKQEGAIKKNSRVHLCSRSFLPTTKPQTPGAPKGQNPHEADLILKARHEHTISLVTTYKFSNEIYIQEDPVMYSLWEMFLWICYWSILVRRLVQYVMLTADILYTETMRIDGYRNLVTYLYRMSGGFRQCSLFVGVCCKSFLGSVRAWRT